MLWKRSRDLDLPRDWQRPWEMQEDDDADAPLQLTGKAPHVTDSISIVS